MIRLRRLVAIILVLVAVASGGYAGWRYHRYLQSWQNRKAALRLAQEGSFSEAEPLLKESLQAHAGDVEVIKALVLGCLAHSRSSEAAEYLTRWCELQPDRSEPYRRRMALFQGMGRLVQALSDGDRVLELEPDNDEIQKQVISILIQEGRFAEVERRCRRELARRPDHPGLRYYLALACQKEGNVMEARAVLDRLITQHPEIPDPLILRAILHREANEDGEAIPLLRKALGKEPGRNHARYQLAQALLRAGHAEEGKHEMDEFLRRSAIERLLYDIQLQPDNVDLQAKAAEALLKDGETEEGMRIVRKILARDPNHAAALRLREAQGPKTRY